MKNRYEVDGDTVRIDLRSSRHGWKICLIDLIDLPTLLALNGTWLAIPARKSETKFYAQAKRRVDGKSHSIFMHRILCGEPKGVDVHHKDNDGLNNKRGNLEDLTHQGNIRERWPGKDWVEHDRRKTLAEEYRQERDIARQVQSEFELTRTGVWKIRNGSTRKSKATLAYLSACQAAGVRPYSQLRQDHVVHGKFGAIRGQIVAPLRAHDVG